MKVSPLLQLVLFLLCSLSRSSKVHIHLSIPGTRGTTHLSIPGARGTTDETLKCFKIKVILINLGRTMHSFLQAVARLILTAQTVTDVEKDFWTSFLTVKNK